MVRNDALAIAQRKNRSTQASNLTDLAVSRPVDELEREESYRAVWSALRTLPPEQAEVVVLKIWEGMTFAEVARVLELSPNTVASRYQYAMAKLNKRLSAAHRKVSRG
jgi:RNA polymerase sigma-70 factor (ECF subfamily)